METIVRNRVHETARILAQIANDMEGVEGVFVFLPSFPHTAQVPQTVPNRGENAPPRRETQAGDVLSV